MFSARDASKPSATRRQVVAGIAAASTAMLAPMTTSASLGSARASSLSIWAPRLREPMLSNVLWLDGEARVLALIDAMLDVDRGASDALTAAWTKKLSMMTGVVYDCRAGSWSAGDQEPELIAWLDALAPPLTGPAPIEHVSAGNRSLAAAFEAGLVEQVTLARRDRDLQRSDDLEAARCAGLQLASRAEKMPMISRGDCAFVRRAVTYLWTREEVFEAQFTT